jgi:hypothetical protein
MAILITSVTDNLYSPRIIYGQAEWYLRPPSGMFDITAHLEPYLILSGEFLIKGAMVEGDKWST